MNDSPPIQKGVVHILVVLVVIILVSTVGFLLWKSSGLKSPGMSSSEQSFISPFALVPYISHNQSRQTICEFAVLPDFKELCNEKYSNVSAGDMATIDELIATLDKAKEDSSLSDYDRFLVGQLVFASLPIGTGKDAMVIPRYPMSLIPEVNAQASMTQAEYANLLAGDLSSVLANCPASGFDNWVINASCSVHSWVNRERQPIYSKTYAEVGGPCAFSDAGAVEGFRVSNIVNTKLSSEQNFTDAQGVSSQIACSFTCGSYNCPKYEEEFLNPYCEAKGSQNIYMSFPGYENLDFMDIPQKARQVAAENAEAECIERSYDYITQSDGTTKSVKARDCKIRGGGRADWRRDPPDYDIVRYETYCCSCERPVRESYVSIYDFTSPGYSGGDLLNRLLDVAAPPPAIDAPPKTTEEVTVLVINGQNYPIDQFVLEEPDECDSKHWHAWTTVKSLEGTSADDPNPNGCGFGKESEILVKTVFR